jgi:C2H2 type zinc-finger (2 copies)
MKMVHGLFVPEREYLIDLRGLIIYLGEKIGVGNLCLFCGKSFTSAEGARAHMVLHPFPKTDHRSTRVIVKSPIARPQKSLNIPITTISHHHTLKPQKPTSLKTTMIPNGQMIQIPIPHP